MECPTCLDKRVVKNKAGKLVVCMDCVDADRLIKSLQTSLESSSANPEKIRQYHDLQAILRHLPKYPAVAVLEAYERNMDPDFIKLLQKVFNVRNLK